MALPKDASRVFVNMTLERAKEKAEKFWELNGEKMMQAYEHLREMGKEKLMASKIDELYSSFGEGTSPDIVTAQEYLQS